MGSILLDSLIGEPVNALAGAGQLVGDWRAVIFGVLLIVAAVVVIHFVKKIIVNSILGVIAWAVLNYVVGIELPTIASFVVSAIFGLAGIGVLLILRFLALI